MIKPKGVIKNTLYLLVSGQVSKLINFLQVILLVRYLGKNDYGVWSLSQSLPAMFLVIADMGLSSVMLRRISRDKEGEGKYLAQVLFVKVALSAIFMLSVFAFLEVSAYEYNVRLLVYAMSFAYLASSFSQTIIAVFRAHENFAFESMVEAVKSLLFLTLAASMIFFDMKLRGLVLSMLAVEVLAMLFCYLWYANKIRPIVLQTFRAGTYIGIFKESLPFAFLAFIYPVFFQIDIIMLSQMSSYESVGVYTAPYKIILFLFVIPMALNRVLFPRLSGLYSQSREKYRKTIADACRIATILAMPMAVGLFLLADKIIVLLFSSEYAASIVSLKIMSFCLILFFVRSIFGAALYASNMEKPAVAMLGLATMLNAALDYMMIPRWDYNGAAAASLISEAAIFLGYYMYVRRDMLAARQVWSAAKVALSSAIMGLSVIFSGPLSLIPQISVGAMTYLISIHFLRVLNNEEYGAIRQLIKI